MRSIPSILDWFLSEKCLGDLPGIHTYIQPRCGSVPKHLGLANPLFLSFLASRQVFRLCLLCLWLSRSIMHVHLPWPQYDAYVLSLPAAVRWCTGMPMAVSCIIILAVAILMPVAS